MSAFLGYIHHWLYHKITRVVEREQFIYQKAANLCGDRATEIQAEVWQIYGEPLKGELAEMIDHNNIHGWLQRQVTIAETREAAFIKELMGVCGETAQEIITAAYEEHGTLCGAHARLQGKYNAAVAPGIYQAVNDYLLNGMPCDQADVVTVETDSKVVWENEVCLQERNWVKAGVDRKLMKELYKQWLAAFVAAVNDSFTYVQSADMLAGDKVNRHEIVKQ